MFPCSTESADQLLRVYHNVINATLEECRGSQNLTVLAELKRRWSAAVRARVEESMRRRAEKRKVPQGTGAAEEATSVAVTAAASPSSSLVANASSVAATNASASPSSSYFGESASYSAAQSTTGTPAGQDEDEFGDAEIHVAQHVHPLKEDSAAAVGKEGGGKEEEDEFADAEEVAPPAIVPPVVVVGPPPVVEKERGGTSGKEKGKGAKSGTKGKHGQLRVEVGEIVNPATSEDEGVGSDLDAEDLSDLEDEEPDCGGDLIVAQFDKVIRTEQRSKFEAVEPFTGASKKNLWKATLINGIMRIGGEELIFEKLEGEFQF